MEFLGLVQVLMDKMQIQNAGGLIYCQISTRSSSLIIAVAGSSSALHALAGRDRTQCDSDV